MNPDEAKSEARYLRGLFPSITPEQGAFWTKEFLRYDQPVVRAALDKYHGNHNGGFVVGASLTSAIWRERERQRQVSRQLDVLDAATVAYWQDVDRLIEATPDDELECWRDTLLGDPKTGAGARAMLEKRDVRKSKTLKGMIYDAITKQVKGAAA